MKSLQVGVCTNLPDLFQLCSKELNPCDHPKGWSLPHGRRDKHTLTEFRICKNIQPLFWVWVQRRVCLKKRHKYVFFFFVLVRFECWTLKIKGNFFCNLFGIFFIWALACFGKPNQNSFVGKLPFWFYKQIKVSF